MQTRVVICPFRKARDALIFVRIKQNIKNKEISFLCGMKVEEKKWMDVFVKQKREFAAATSLIISLDCHFTFFFTKLERALISGFPEVIFSFGFAMVIF